MPPIVVTQKVSIVFPISLLICKERSRISQTCGNEKPNQAVPPNSVTSGRQVMETMRPGSTFELSLGLPHLEINKNTLVE